MSTTTSFCGEIRKISIHLVKKKKIFYSIQIFNATRQLSHIEADKKKSYLEL